MWGFGLVVGEGAPTRVGVGEAVPLKVNRGFCVVVSESVPLKVGEGFSLSVGEGCPVIVKGPLV